MGRPEPDRRNDWRTYRLLEKNPSDLLVATKDVVQLVTITEITDTSITLGGALDRFKVVPSERTTDDGRFTIRIRAVWDVENEKELHEARISISENIGSGEEGKPTATALYFRYASDRDYVLFKPKNGMSSVGLMVAFKELGLPNAGITLRAEMKRRKT